MHNPQSHIMSNNVFYGVAIVLVISAAALGYMLLNPAADQGEVAIVPTPSQQVPQNQTQPATPAPVAPVVSVLAAENLDPAIVKIATTFPADGAPQDAYKKQFDAVSKYAKDSIEMQIGQSCTTNPRFIRTKENGSITFRNIDVVPHKIALAPGHEYVVEAGKTNTIKLDFIKAPALNGYNCDPSKDHGLTGVIMVLKP